MVYTKREIDINLKYDENDRTTFYFTQKDRYGATELYSLAEYKVRNDASFEKDYLSGKYGAIPIVGDLTRLFNTQEN